MNKVAESGIAAHWQYKATDKKIIPPQVRAREWLKSISEMQSAANSEEFMEHVKVDLFPDNVYVFTPKERSCDYRAVRHVSTLPTRCIPTSATVVLRPRSTDGSCHCGHRSRTGQTVEIITAKSASPDPRWVNFVVTAKARYSVRQYLKNLQHGEARDLGRRLLNQSLRDAGSSLRKISRGRMKSMLDEYRHEHDANELFEKVGLGERLAPLVAKILLEGPSTDGPAAAISSPYHDCGHGKPHHPLCAVLLSDSRRYSHGLSELPGAALSYIVPYLRKPQRISQATR